MDCSGKLTVTSIPLSILAPMLIAIGDRNYRRFNRSEQDFVKKHSVEDWQEAFNILLLPILDKQSKNWLLTQKLQR